MFEVPEESLDRLSDWTRNHNRTCVFADPLKCGTIGGRWTYSFTPTQLGIVCKVTCACGESIDVSDYDSW